METFMVVIFMVFLAMGIPIVWAMALSSLGVLLWGHYSLLIIIQRLFSGTDSFILTAVPFFVVAGSLMTVGGITPRLMGFAQSWVGHLRGGLCFVMIIGEMILSGITGSATADTAAIGSLMIPAMEKEGYGKRFSCSVTAAAGTLGIIIPPSIPMIIYGAVSGASIGRLFLGGFIPGIIVGAAMMVPSYITARKRNFPKKPRASLKDIWESTKRSFIALIMPVVIIGSIVGGIVTPTEAGVLAVVYAFVVGFFIYRELKIKHLWGIFREAVTVSATIMIIMSVASIFSYILADLEMPRKVADFFMSITQNRNMILLLVNIFLLIVGCFVDMGPAIIILTPIFLPLLQRFGVDPIHFGLIMMVNLGIGLFTPPVGTNLYVACAVGKITLGDLSKGIIPYVAWSAIALMIITYFPQSVLFLPNLLMK